MSRTNQPPGIRYPLGSPAPVVPVGAPIVPDWAAYWRAFCAAHAVDGGGPVLDGGVFLFGDGWRYAADSYEGPEYPPPVEAEHYAQLQRRYWTRRLDIVRAERDKLAHLLGGLNEQRRGRGVPLFVRRYLAEPGGGIFPDLEQPVQEADEQWWADQLGRLRWLVQDVGNCDKRLSELGA